MKLNTRRLQEEIFRSNMSQRMLADKVGVSEVSMSRYVNGTRTPRGRILIKIAKALMTTPEYLTGIDGMKNPDEAFAQTRMNIKTYASGWTKELKQELINEILNTMK